MKKTLIKKVEQPELWMTELDGGDDLTTPVLKVDPKMALFTFNYEADVSGGYSRTGNFERFDGRPKPSDAVYYALEFDAGTAAFSEGETVTGGTSGATAQVMSPQTLEFGSGMQKFQVGDTITGGTSTADAEIVWIQVTAGSWRGGDAVGYFYLKDVAGTFIDGEVLTSSHGKATSGGANTDLPLDSGAWVNGDAAGELLLTMLSGNFIDNEPITSAGGAAVADGSELANGASTDAVNAAATMHSISATRDDILPIAGSGNIVGIMGLNGEIFAFRNNAGGTAKDLWKATTGGWVNITLPSYIEFDAGTGAFTEGQVVTGTTSTATGTIDKIMIVSGTTGGSNQVGRLYLSSVSGTFQDNETLTDPLTGAATSASALTAVSIAPGGHLENIVHNFTGNPDNRRIYGVDGVSEAFEFDGTDYFPIPTANSIFPDHVAEHKNYLFLSFGPSVQHSGLGEPTDWSAIAGAVELALGDDVTGFSAAPGDILVMFTRTSTELLYGASASAWEIKTHNDEGGAIEYTVQRIGNVIYLDDLGLMSLRSTDQYGDFSESSISKMVDPKLTELKGTVSTSMRVKEKNQYRLFFTDGTGYHVRIDRKQPAFTRINYGKTVYAALATEDTSGNELLFFGSDDGYVYQLDVGRSADGDPIEAYYKTPYWSLKTPRQRKHFKQAIIQADAAAGTEIEFTPEFNYGTYEKPRGRTEDFSLASGGGFWDIATWGEFNWDGQSIGEATAYLDGEGRNVSLLIRNYSAHEPNHTLESIIMHYFKRGLQR